MKKFIKTFFDDKTYTKRAVKALLVIGVISANIPFVLSAFGKDTVEALGIAWITEIVAVILGYLCKAYFETKQKRKQDLEDFKEKFEGLNDE